MISCELYLYHILIKLHLYEWKPLANAQVNSIDLLNFLQDRPTLFIVFHVVFIINLFCVSAEKSCNFGDVHRAPSSHPNLETKLKCDENKMARQWDVYSLDPVNIPRPRPQIHLHPHSLLYTYVSPIWVSRPTNNVSKIWKKYHSVPSIALHKLRQLVHNGLGRVLRYLQGEGREGEKVISNFCILIDWRSTTLSKTVALSPWLSIPSTTFSCKPRALELCFVIVLFLFWKLETWYQDRWQQQLLDIQVTLQYLPPADY